MDPETERFNKRLADFRKMYEANGASALPEIRKTALFDPDPAVRIRAIEYMVQLRDSESVPVLEDIIFELAKRVSFGDLGVGSDGFRVRLKAAHALAGFQATSVSSKLWARFERMDKSRRTEVPYLLNALSDPELTGKLTVMLEICEDHQVLLAVLDTFNLSGGPESLNVLGEKSADWARMHEETRKLRQTGRSIEYSIRRIKAQKAIRAIKERARRSGTE